MEKLTKEEVLHVATLARLKVDEEEINRYAVQLTDILTEIAKIEEVDVKEDKMIAPTSNKNRYSEDEVGKMFTPEEIMKNVKNRADNYVVVPRVINE